MNSPYPQIFVSCEKQLFSGFPCLVSMKPIYLNMQLNKIHHIFLTFPSWMPKQYHGGTASVTKDHGVWKGTICCSSALGDFGY